MKTKHMPECFCPVCFKLLDAVSMLEDVEPAPGDRTVCWGCASVLRFADDMMLMPSSLMDIPEHSRLPFAQLVQTVKEMIGEKSGAKEKRPLT